MKISAQISYYPLAEQKFRSIISEVIKMIKPNDIEIQYSIMATILIGEHRKILEIVEKVIDLTFTKFESILDVKFSNACLT